MLCNLISLYLVNFFSRDRIKEIIEKLLRNFKGKILLKMKLIEHLVNCFIKFCLQMAKNIKTIFASMLKTLH